MEHDVRDAQPGTCRSRDLDVIIAAGREVIMVADALNPGGTRLQKRKEDMAGIPSATQRDQGPVRGRASSDGLAKEIDVPIDCG